MGCQINSISALTPVLVKHPVTGNKCRIKPSELKILAYARKCLFKLHQVIHADPVINYFEEERQDLDTVLRIFVRTNSGGTPLSYSDLLLSIATSQWRVKDARKEILDLVDELNGTGDQFMFDKDFVLKSCLVLSDFKKIAFNVANFNADNMAKIESRWDVISNALRVAVTLVSSFGLNARTLTANNAVIPIAYYLLRRGADHRFVSSSGYREDRDAIKRWLIVSLIKRSFGGQPDTVLRPIRDVIRKESGLFPFESIRDKMKKIRPIRFDEDDLDELLNYTQGNRYTFLILSLLYPTLNYRDHFHQDHIFPRSFFTSSARLSSKGVAPEEHEFYLDHYNNLGNLQLLPGIPNQEKRDKDFEDWFDSTCPDLQSKVDYRKKHYIPDLDLTFGNFKEFLVEREKLLLVKLKSVLMN